VLVISVHVGDVESKLSSSRVGARYEVVVVQCWAEEKVLAAEVDAGRRELGGWNDIGTRARNLEDGSRCYSANLVNSMHG